MTLLLALYNPVNSTILRKCKKKFSTICQTFPFDHLLRYHFCDYVILFDDNIFTHKTTKFIKRHTRPTKFIRLLHNIWDHIRLHFFTSSKSKELCNVNNILSYFIPGMHNIRPAGQMWPVKAFNMALKALTYTHLAWFLM